MRAGYVIQFSGVRRPGSGQIAHGDLDPDRPGRRAGTHGSVGKWKTTGKHPNDEKEWITVKDRSTVDIPRKSRRSSIANYALPALYPKESEENRRLDATPAAPQ